ncbi:eCIS core domain-containing protein [Alkalinema pantanalense CENA528]|uniref:eCIS core domain-containing protein n=1 Tax=Alkalinema pantanalense TaxID=1620705 RepID=UPI003D6F59D5
METARHKTATRSASPAPKPAAAPRIQRKVVATAGKVQGQVQCQSAMKVSSPQDSAEKEADRTAQKIMRMAVPESSISYVRTEKGSVFRQVKPEEKEKDKKIQRQLQSSSLRSPSLQSPYIQRFANTGIFTQRNREDSIHRKAEGQPNVASNVAAEIQASTATGAPLPLTVRRFMEPRFQANFSQVKIHTGDRSAKLNRQLNAQAFTVGNQIFFGKDKFKPDSQEGKELIAHELTHTIQQGAAIQRREAVSVTPVSVTQQAPVQVQRLGLSDALDYFADKANLIPGFRMFTIILGVNPINMSRVERSAANILRAIVEFLPGGGLITQALDNYGVFDRVGAWIEQQIQSLGMTGSVIRQAIDQFLDSLSWTDIFDLGGVWNRAKRIFTEPIDRIISFGRNLVTGIIRFVKEAILRPLARLAEGTRGYDLLKAVLGQDPITGDPVPRNADTLIGGFMKLIGQEEVWNNLKQANAVARAWAWFQGSLAGLLGFVRQIPTLFIQALQSLEIADIVLLPRAFVRVGTVFANFVGRFISWAGQQVMSLLQIIFEVVAPGVMPYIRRAAGAFRSIIQNPIGFVRNLVRAGILGFRQFARNFLTHLRTSLIGWLTGTMSGANIYIPQAFTLREIIKFVLSVLGLTWQNIRQKLVRVIGEPAVQALETGFDIVMTLVTQGPAAAWEKIQESLSNLRDMVMEQIMTFVRDRVVQAAITRLITSLNPAGAFIQAIIATYNTIMFFVERLRQIAQVAMAFIDSVSAIASGVLAAAANRVETTMAGLLTLVISFLARIAGLGRVSDAVTNIINRVRAPIDRALDRVVDWIVTQARRLGRLIMGGRTARPDTRTPAQKQQALMQAVREAQALDPGMGRRALTAALQQIKTRHQLTDLSARPERNILRVHAAINPEYVFELPDLEGLDEAMIRALDAAKVRIDALPAARDTTAAEGIVTQEIRTAAPTARLQFVRTRGTDILQGADIILLTPRRRSLGMIVSVYSSVYRVIGQRGSQRLFHNQINQLEYVLSSTGSRVQRYVGRNINTAEQRILDNSRFSTPEGETITYRDLPPRPGRGRNANKPRVTDPRQHVVNASLPSVFSSTTTLPSPETLTNPRDTGEEFNKSGTIRIDLFRIDPSKIIDLTSPAELNRWGFFSGTIDPRAASDAARTKEVLIRGGIPGNAIVEYTPNG